jgi:aryl-alcohol dehydrogenase-like predicted oxidoreductase
VARSYGLAECFLGAWLKRRAIEPQNVTVGSKWGYYYAANWHIDAERHEIKDHSLPLLRRQWQESSGFLGAQLDLYQIHSATIESRVLDNQEVLLELFRLSQSGIKIGLTLSGPSQAKTLHKALSVRFEGVPLFQCVQATWNLLDPSACGALAEAKAAGWGVIIKEVLANGRLTIRNAEPSFTVKREKLEQQAKRLNTTIDALAISGALAQPWVDVVLSGAVTTDQLRSNLKALKLVWDEEAAAELSIISEPAEQYWAERSKLAWN